MSPDEVAELVRDLYPIESVTEYGSVMVVTRGNERPHSLTRIRGKKGELTRLNKRAVITSPLSSMLLGYNSTQ